MSAGDIPTEDRFVVDDGTLSQRDRLSQIEREISTAIAILDGKAPRYLPPKNGNGRTDLLTESLHAARTRAAIAMSICDREELLEEVQS